MSKTSLILEGREEVELWRKWRGENGECCRYGEVGKGKGVEGGDSVSNKDSIGGKRQVVLNGYTSLEVAF